jgi:hypothetical protein
MEQRSYIVCTGVFLGQPSLRTYADTTGEALMAGLDIDDTINASIS